MERKALWEMDADEFVKQKPVIGLCVEAFMHRGIRDGPGVVVVDRREQDSYGVGYLSVGKLELEGDALDITKHLVGQTMVGWPEFGLTAMVRGKDGTRILFVLPPWDVLNQSRYRFERGETIQAAEYRQGGAKWA